MNPTTPVVGKTNGASPHVVPMCITIGLAGSGARIHAKTRAARSPGGRYRPTRNTTAVPRATTTTEITRTRVDTGPHYTVAGTRHPRSISDRIVRPEAEAVFLQTINAVLMEFLRPLAIIATIDIEKPIRR